MSNTITGYQYSPEHLNFIGEYQIHLNPENPENIHLPPHTTLEPPIDNDDPFKIVKYVEGKWILESLL